LIPFLTIKLIPAIGSIIINYLYFYLLIYVFLAVSRLAPQFHFLTILLSILSNIHFLYSNHFRCYKHLFIIKDIILAPTPTSFDFATIPLFYSATTLQKWVIIFRLKCLWEIYLQYPLFIYLKCF